jgi:tRNA pseudouridine(38-40) synthase
VSAFGQVIALLIRSRIPKLDGKGREIREEVLPKNSFEPISVLQKKVENKHNQEKVSQNDETHNTTNQSSRNFGDEFVQELTFHEFDYCRILNGVLPDTIRAIGWTPVSDQFSARFSAMDRTYRYFFVRKNYNLSAMQQALDKLIGTHDFRNLCKMDTEAVSNFQRCIKYAKLVVLCDHGDTSKMGGVASTLSKGYRQMCYFEICGQAFLWHMIRCIVAVCFMVGAGHEEPSVVDALLDINKCPAKPSYAMASDLPLVLHSCSYQNVTFGHSSASLWELTNTLERRWEEAAIAAERIRNALESLQQETYVQIDEFCSFLNDILGSKQQQKQGNNNGITNEAISLQDKNILETIRKVQERQILKGANKDDIVLQSFSSSSQHSSHRATDTTITTTSATEKSIISWRCALAAIYELGFPPLTSSGPINGSNGFGRKPILIHKHVKLMKRSTGTTYEEKILSMKGKKRERYESNMMKKQQPADDQKFYERMTKYGGSGV